MVSFLSVLIFTGKEVGREEAYRKRKEKNQVVVAGA